MLSQFNALSFYIVLIVDLFLNCVLCLIVARARQTSHTQLIGKTCARITCAQILQRQQQQQQRLPAEYAT